MIAKEEARKIGINACIDKLGQSFVEKYRDFSTAAYGDCEGGVYCFVGVDDDPVNLNTENVLILDNAHKFPYRASYEVSTQDGSLRFLECVLPV